MKKLLRAPKMLCAALAFIAAATTFSSTANTIDVGYANLSQDQVWPGDGFSTNDDESVYVAAILTPDMVERYAGGRIVGFRVGWSSYNRDGVVDLFVREGDLNSANAAEQNGMKVKFGWNEVKFDTPYVIPENPDNTIIGYHVNTVAGDYCLPTSVLGLKPAHSFYITNDRFKRPDGKYEWEDASQQFDALLILALVEMDKDILDRAVIREIVAPEVFEQGTIGTGRFTIYNQGTNDINAVTLKYTCGELTEEHDIALGSPIKPNKAEKISMPVHAMATGQMSVSISKVNGNANVAENALNIPILAVPKEVAQRYSRRPLLEYFGSEGSHLNVQYYEDLFMKCYEPYEDQMTIVCHHLNDQFMTRDDEDTQMLLDLADGDLTAVQVPCMALDRSLQIAHPYAGKGTVAYSVMYPAPSPFAAPVYDEAMAVPTFASLDIDYSYDEDNAEMTIDVEGNIEPGVLPAGEKLKLTVYLLENNVASASQDWADAAQQEQYGGIYNHQNLIRQQPTPIWGDELDGDGVFARQYKTEIDPEEWKGEDLHIVAVIHRSENNAQQSRQVINSADLYSDISSIREVAVDGSDIENVSVEGGVIKVNGSAAGVSVYTASGAQVPNTNLPAGFYIISAGAATAKVIVK